MTKHDALRLLEEMLEVGPDTLTPERRLWDLAGWDSLATMTFIALVDRELRLPLPGNRVADCETVGELLSLLEPAFARRAA